MAKLHSCVGQLSSALQTSFAVGVMSAALTSHILLTDNLLMRVGVRTSLEMQADGITAPQHLKSFGYFVCMSCSLTGVPRVVMQ